MPAHSPPIYLNWSVPSLSLSALIDQHVVLPHAQIRVLQYPCSRHQPHRLQNCHHRRRCKGDAQRDPSPHLNRRRFHHKKGFVFCRPHSLPDTVHSPLMSKCRLFSSFSPAISLSVPNLMICSFPFLPPNCPPHPLYQRLGSHQVPRRRPDHPLCKSPKTNRLCKPQQARRPQSKWRSRYFHGFVPFISSHAPPHLSI